MFSLSDSESESLSTVSKLFWAYASWTALEMLVRSIANDLIPTPLRSYFQSATTYLLTPLSNQLTLLIHHHSAGTTPNHLFDAAHTYLRAKTPSSTPQVLRLTKTLTHKNITITLQNGQNFLDTFRDIYLTWRFVSSESEQFFELSFHKKHKDVVLNEYLPFILNKLDQIKHEEKVLKIYALGCPRDEESGNGVWGSVSLDHPATFETVAMEVETRRMVMEDLERFVRRREFYRRVGRAWKRGYLVYGPPGTGKSSLVAAMANYLKFDVYYLELNNIYSNTELRRTMVATTNRSIIVVEDIDCSHHPQEKFTLSWLVNFIDGLWSNCGDERLIIVTTNFKKRLDPALLRPGRMDMHISMSYCSIEVFKQLAFNYLNTRDHELFAEIDALLENVKVTPVEVIQELMRNEDPDVALSGIVSLLKRKEMKVNKKKKKSRS